MEYFDNFVGIAAAGFLCTAVLSACHAPTESPQLTVTAATMAAAVPGAAGNQYAEATMAPYAPPPKRAEIPPPPPSPHSLWQGGHWSWDGAKYVWARVRYLERPASTANWLPGYWQEQPGGWIWVPGRWT